jgi:hypothetical protein
MSFTELADANLSLFADGIVSGLTDNPALPSPPVPVDELAEAQEAFANAMSAAALGGKLLTLEKNERREELIALLRQEASYMCRASPALIWPRCSPRDFSPPAIIVFHHRCRRPASKSL